MCSCLTHTVLMHKRLGEEIFSGKCSPFKFIFVTNLRENTKITIFVANPTFYTIVLTFSYMYC
jgi:hypothetical protein